MAPGRYVFILEYGFRILPWPALPAISGVKSLRDCSASASEGEGEEERKR